MRTIAAAVLLLLVSQSLAQTDLNSTYQFSANLHDRYTLYWSIDNDAQMIRFAVRVRTTGWVGFGLSPNGQMPQSDVVIGWVDNAGRDYFDDRFAKTRSLPTVDEEQNWFSTRASEEGGYTTLEFYRNYTSCDIANDRDIKHETSRVVWSWNDNDPVNNVPAFHGLNRGSTSLNLLGGQTSRPQDPPDAMPLAATVQNITIPADETTYWCTGFRIPTIFDTLTVYVTKFAPVISPGSEPYVHHLLMYVCDGLDGLDLTTEQGACHTLDHRIQSCLGGLLIGAWAVGGETFTYPSNVAYPVGGPGFPRYVVMELHYNNPNKVSGVRDSSGLMFTYSLTKREHDAGIMQVGHQVRFTQVIPPGAQNYSTYGTCHSSCTSALPANGIRVFGNLLHTHLIGTGLELSVLRENSSLGNNCFDETKLVERNLNYDFNFQQFVYLPNEVSIMPGDTLLLRCVYDSSKKSNITVGGLSTQEEMCLAFMVYYPRVDLSICQSIPRFNDIGTFLTKYVPPNLQQQFLNAVNSNTLSSSLLQEIFNQLPWTPQMIQDLETSIYTTGSQLDICISTNDITTAISNTPDICNPLTERNVCLGSPGSAAALISHFMVLAGLALIALLVVIV